MSPKVLRRLVITELLHLSWQLLKLSHHPCFYLLLVTVQEHWTQFEVSHGGGTVDLGKALKSMQSEKHEQKDRKVKELVTPAPNKKRQETQSWRKWMQEERQRTPDLIISKLLILLSLSLFALICMEIIHKGDVAHLWTFLWHKIIFFFLYFS